MAGLTGPRTSSDANALTVTPAMLDVFLELFEEPVGEGEQSV